MTKTAEPQTTTTVEPQIVMNEKGQRVPADTLEGFDPRFRYDNSGQAFLDGEHFPSKAIGLANKWHDSKLHITGKGATV